MVHGRWRWRRGGVRNGGPIDPPDRKGPPQSSHAVEAARGLPNTGAEEGAGTLILEYRRYYSAIVARTAASLTATVALALGVATAGSSASPLRYLQAWAGPSHSPQIGVTASGYSPRPRIVKHLSPGTYQISIVASEALGFQLTGPGFNRHTRVVTQQIPGSNYATNTHWTIRLRRGVYRYHAIGPYAGGLHPASGSFQVP